MARTGRFLSVQADVSRAQAALSGTSKSLKSISKQTLGIIARGTVKVIKAEIRATTKKDTGELLKAYRYKVKKNGDGATVFPKGIQHEGRKIFPKVMALSYGREKDRLRARGFVQAGDKYIESGNYGPEIQKMIDKELAKYWGW